jgi:hypothetical protein
MFSFHFVLVGYGVNIIDLKPEKKLIMDYFPEVNA